jgi:hypothetical protein
MHPKNAINNVMKLYTYNLHKIGAKILEDKQKPEKRWRPMKAAA